MRRPILSLPATHTYLAALHSRLDALVASPSAAFARAVDAVYRALNHDAMIYVFGTGHSHMIA